MMKKSKIRFEIEDKQYNFSYKKSDLKINFNRVAFIFFILVLISIIFSIHLIHLGSRQSKIINENHIKVKVWERGAGLTKACGTAACATAFAAKQNGLINDKVDIEFSTGRLTISIDENNSIHMKGPVSDIEEINFKI